VTGVLLVGLVVGHFGLDVPQASHNIGFLLFIYCIGAQAGPQFLRVFREDGSRYGWLSLVTATRATLLAIQASHYFDFDVGAGAGLLAGALTSTPTLVAAQDAVSQGIVLPQGVTAREALDNISSAYAITYVFGMGGLVLFVGLMPRLLKIDLAAEARALSEKKGFGIDPQAPPIRPVETPQIRAYRVEKELPSGFQFDSELAVPGEIQKIKRGDEVFTPQPETVPLVGDIISVVGLRNAHDLCREAFGPEVIDQDVLDRSVESRNIVVTRTDAAGKTLSELELGGPHQVWLTEFTRSGVPMPRRPDLELQIGDVLLLTGPRSKIDAVGEKLGEAESELQQTDLVTLAFGIALGSFLGMISFKIGNAQIGLGSAGGVMIVGLVFGLINSYRPQFGRLPEGARYILSELGCCSSWRASP
jgi:putative transport protein